jgi:hypothetical protein
LSWSRIVQAKLIAVDSTSFDHVDYDSVREAVRVHLTET